MATEIFIALGSALLAAILTFLLSTWLSFRAENVALLNDHIQQVDRIEGLAVAYWLVDAEDSPAESDGIAAQLNGALSASSIFSEVAPGLLGYRLRDYEAKDLEIYEAATGGTFQTKDRPADFHRVSHVISICNEQRLLLRNARRNIYWFQ